jgi:hypothetical protein
MTLFFCATTHPALWMCATVSSGSACIAARPCPLSRLQSSQLGLACALKICNHLPHGNEHVITWVARLFFASWTAPDANHKPKDSLLSPSMFRKSAAHVVAPGDCLFSASWSGRMHSHPQRALSIISPVTPAPAACRTRSHPVSAVRRSSLIHLLAALASTRCLWNSAPPWSIAVRTAFDHADTRFTPLSVHSYSNLGVRVVHCL